MNNRSSQTSIQSRPLWLSVLVILPLLGWLGLFDNYSANHIDGSITSGGLMYGTARGINALVSVLQGTEVSIPPFVTLSIGEILDPVNDLIERFSRIVLLALGSLALQKILLSVTSSGLFNIALTVTAALAAYGLFSQNPALRSSTLRVFIVVAFLRFALGLVVIANNWVDATFLLEADNERHEQMRSFQAELRDLDSNSSEQANAARRLQQLSQRLETAPAVIARSSRAIEEVDLAITQAKSDLYKLKQEAGTACRWAPDIFSQCPAPVLDAQQRVDTLEALKDDLEDKLDRVENAVDDLREQAECNEKIVRGESCGFGNFGFALPDKDELRAKFLTIEADLGEFVDSSVALLASLLLKTIVIPLMFLYLLLKLSGVAWKKTESLSQ